MPIELEFKLSLGSSPVASQVNTVLGVVYRSKSGRILYRTEPALVAELMTFNNNAEVYFSQININHTEVKFTHNFP